ncbi:MAG: MnmC family methyltransferase [Candidatus Woesearchaeota archaeon]
MEKIITKDGTFTFHNKKYDEYYHSLTGAKEEAVEKYAKPAIKFLKENGLLNKNIAVLDFCFGLGYNSLYFVDEVRKLNDNININIIGIDNDLEIVTIGRNLTKGLLDKHIYGNDSIRIEVKIGDGEQEVKKLDKFDICFFDPFSPKKCPELWEEKIFKEIYTHLKKPGILLTYSCARKVRENLKNVGFKVIDGPCVGRNAPATIAIKEFKV